MKKIGFLACVAAKKDYTTIAKDLYISPLFIKGKEYVERYYDEWYILSAKHYLLNPNDRVQPYDEILREKPLKSRKKWADKVFIEIKKKFPDSNAVRLYIHAGIMYRKYLLPLLLVAGYKCEVPLEGLGIGKQLAWYDKHNHGHRC